jgi:hypothetical protein
LCKKAARRTKKSVQWTVNKKGNVKGRGEKKVLLLYYDTQFQTKNAKKK